MIRESGKLKTKQGNLSFVRSTLLITTAAVLLLFFSMHRQLQAQSAQSGRIMGKVVSVDTGEPMIGASVMVDGTKFGAVADLDGNYIINNVPVGTYRLIISAIGHARVTVDNVEVNTGKALRLDISLKSEEVVGEKVVVEAERVRNSEAALLSMRQRAQSAQDAISSEAIARAGAGDAAAAMARVTGASVVDGRTAVIRGLSGRYSNTQLDGSQLPSTDPDKPAVQLDLIPTGLLDNIVVKKTFTPDQQGNFSGGAINLNTKDLPERMTLKLSTSVSYNSNVSLKEGVITHSGSSKEWLGFDGGYRAAPDFLVDSNFALPNYTTVRNSNEAERAHYLDRAAKALSREFVFSERKAPLNRGYSLSYGNLHNLFNRPLSLIASLSYSNVYSYTPDGVYRKWEVSGYGGELTGLGIFQDYTDTKASEEVLWGGLISGNLAINPSNKIRFTFNRNQHGEKISRVLEGEYRTYTTEPTQRLRSRTFQYTERSMQSIQYGGDHSLVLPLLSRSRFDWSVASSRNTQDDPDLRFWRTSPTSMRKIA